MSKTLKKTAQIPLGPRLSFINRRLELQTQKLNQAIERFTQRDKAIFARIVDALTKHDQARANVFSNELVEVRQMLHTIFIAKLDIEETSSRLQEQSLGGTANIDDVESLAIAAAILQNARTGLISIFPEAEGELGEIYNSISGVTLDAGISIGDGWLDFADIKAAVDDELSDKATLADQQIKDKYPALPETPKKPSEES